MKTRLSRILILMLTVFLLAPSALAATRADIDNPSVFLKQERSGTCTLASTAMMLRRTAMLMGNRNWASITESSLRNDIWRSGRGLPYEYTWNGISVGHGRLPGGEANNEILIRLLAEHPEGIVLHAAGVPHGVLLTDYTNGVFYCADPAPDIAFGRVPITQAHGTRTTNSYAYWYVISPQLCFSGPTGLKDGLSSYHLNDSLLPGVN